MIWISLGVCAVYLAFQVGTTKIRRYAVELYVASIALALLEVGLCSSVRWWVASIFWAIAAAICGWSLRREVDYRGAR